MTGSPAFSAAGQNQSAVPSVSQPIIVGVVERHAHAEHARLLLPLRQQRDRFRILQRDAAHDGEAVGISLGRLQRVVVAVARPAWRDDDGAVDAGVVHHRHELLDSERLGELRLAPGTHGQSGDSAFHR